jgi:hypothetical protein
MSSHPYPMQALPPATAAATSHLRMGNCFAAVHHASSSPVAQKHCLSPCPRVPLSTCPLLLDKGARAGNPTSDGTAYLESPDET